MTALRTHPPTRFHETQHKPHETATEARIGRGTNPCSPFLANRRGWSEGRRRSGTRGRPPAPLRAHELHRQRLRAGRGLGELLGMKDVSEKLQSVDKPRTR